MCPYKNSSVKVIGLCKRGKETSKWTTGHVHALNHACGWRGQTPEMSSQSSTANQKEMRVRKWKVSMMETDLPRAKEEEGNDGNSCCRMSMTVKMRNRFQYLLDLPVTGWNFVDLAMLNPFEFQHSVACLIHQPFWSRIFGWRHPMYAPAVYEFVTSLEVIGRSGNLRSPTI
nr:hypothetical protein Iba_chr14dCG1790 [Ipomoea batatas]